MEPRRHSTKEEIYQRLRYGILNLKHEFGESINERALAREYGVSRTPVREALILLRNEGFVESDESGARVRPVTRKHVDDVTEMRLLYEPYIASHVCSILTPAIVKTMNQYLVRQEKYFTANRLEEYIDVDCEFHRYLASLTNNEFLTRSYNLLSDNVYQLGILAAKAEKLRVQSALYEHKSIIDGIESGFIYQAKTQAMMHIYNSKQFIYDYLDL